MAATHNQPGVTRTLPISSCYQPVLIVTVVAIAVGAALVLQTASEVQVNASTDIAMKCIKWDSIASTASWVDISGLKAVLEIPNGIQARVDVIITGHGTCGDGARRLDVSAFDNENPCGIDCSTDSKAFLPGMALSHTVSWIPITAYATFVVEPGVHSITARLRNAANNGEVRIHGAAMIVKVSIISNPSRNCQAPWSNLNAVAECLFPVKARGIRVLREAPPATVVLAQ